MINDGKPITPDMLKQCSLDGPHGAAVRMTELFTNVALMATAEMTQSDMPMTGGVAMTGFACAAGIVQGEMEADGIVPPLDEATIVKFMVENFKTGRLLGLKHKADRAEAKRAAEVAAAADKAAATKH